MNTFNGNRKIKEVYKLLEEKFKDVMTLDQAVDETKFKAGWDFINFLWYIDNPDLKKSKRYGQITWYPGSGWFFVYDADNNKVANYLDTKYDNEKWYQDILELLYLPASDLK